MHLPTPRASGSSRSPADHVSELIGSVPTASLRTLVDTAHRTGEPLLLPGCYDALGARIIEQAGFDAVYMTGFGTTAGLLARPDVGLLGLGEMADNARRISSATRLPVLADADTGYGNAINVARTVQMFEQTGVAGIHIEDQMMPKKCGHMENKRVVPIDEMVAKLEAAAAARSDDDFMIIARTDARAPNGLADAIDRGRRMRDAGADALFIEALQGLGEIEEVAAEFSDTPLLFNWVEGGKTPPLSHQQIAELGFAMLLMPVGMLLAATAAMQQYVAQLKAEGSPINAIASLMGFGEFTDFIGLPEINALEQRFSS